jgi:hypothetical protein
MEKINFRLRYSIPEEILLFLTGMVQVLLVAINTYQLAHKKWIGCFIVGFLISFVWTYNVKRIAFGKFWERVIYALGAAVGTIIGLFISIFFYETLKF